MKSYIVLCKTCGGSGSIMPANFTMDITSNPSTEICPVCNGSKTQMVHETDGVSIIDGIQSGSISLSDAIRMMQ